MRGLDTDRTTKDSAFNGTQTLTEHLTAQDRLRSGPQVSIRRLMAALRTLVAVLIDGTVPDSVGALIALRHHRYRRHVHAIALLGRVRPSRPRDLDARSKLVEPGPGTGRSLLGLRVRWRSVLTELAA